MEYGPVRQNKLFWTGVTQEALTLKHLIQVQVKSIHKQQTT